MSLKQFLLNYIKENGELEYSTLETICHTKHYKLETASRRLRELSNWIYPVYKNNYIIAWRLEVGATNLPVLAPNQSQTDNLPKSASEPLQQPHNASQGTLNWDSAKAFIEKTKRDRFYVQTKNPSN